MASFVTALPVSLLGASAVLLREDIPFDQAQLGYSVAAFSGAFGLFALVGGRMAETRGPRPCLLIAMVCGGASLLGLAGIARTWVHVFLFLLVAGIGNAFGQAGGNLALASGATVRPGVAFGVKQSAAPASTLIAGATVPLIGVTAGWRWSFLGGAALVPLGVLLLLRRFPQGSSARLGDATAPTNWSRMWALAVAYGCGTGAAVSLTAFLVESGVEAGLEIGVSALFLLLGSLLAIAVRIGGGWVTDRRSNADLAIVVTLLCVGMLGYLALAAGTLWLFAVGALAALGAGWGWNGVLNHAIVRMNRRNPGTATGLAMAGMAVGGVLWPMAFGVIASRVGLSAAWLATAALVAAGTTIVLLVKRAIGLEDRDRSGTETDAGSVPGTC